MATNGKAWAHGSATHPARVLRQMAAFLAGVPWASHANSATATTRAGAYGVVQDADLLVTTTGSLGYSVAAGRVGGPGTFAAGQGFYTGYNDAAVTGNVGARHATLTRVDYIAWRVRDTDEDATGAEDDGIVVIAGTPGSGAPSVPSSLGTLVILSEVTVPSSAAGTPLTFVDRRKLISGPGGVRVRTSSTRDTGVGLRAGDPTYDTDTGDLVIWNGAAHIPVMDTGQTYTPTWNASVGSPAIGNGSIIGHYGITGKWCDLTIQVVAGSTTSGGSGSWSFTLPPGASAVGSLEQIGGAKIFDPVTAQGNVYGFSLVASGGTTVAPVFPLNLDSNVMLQGRNADATSAAGTGIPNVGAAYPLVNGGNIVLTIRYRIA